jgi:hypothetical protein
MLGDGVMTFQRGSVLSTGGGVAQGPECHFKQHFACSKIGRSETVLQARKAFWPQWKFSLK